MPSSFTVDNTGFMEFDSHRQLRFLLFFVHVSVSRLLVHQRLHVSRSWSLFLLLAFPKLLSGRASELNVSPFRTRAGSPAPQIQRNFQRKSTRGKYYG